MNMKNLLDQFTGASSAGKNAAPAVGGLAAGLGKLSNNIPEGLLGGAAAGGIMALLVGNKSARKFASKAATYGGAALLGGVAFKAYNNWQKNNANEESASFNAQVSENQQYRNSETEAAANFQLTLVKAMIAAAKADGHIDDDEQRRIFDSVDQMNLPAETKGLVFDLLRQPIAIEEFANGADSIEMKSEIYLASCLAINPDHPSEQFHLHKLAQVLQLPSGLPEHLKMQAEQALN